MWIWIGKGVNTRPHGDISWVVPWDINFRSGSKGGGLVLCGINTQVSFAPGISSGEVPRTSKKSESTAEILGWINLYSHVAIMEEVSMPQPCCQHCNMKVPMDTLQPPSHREIMAGEDQCILWKYLNHTRRAKKKVCWEVTSSWYQWEYFSTWVGL